MSKIILNTCEILFLSAFAGATEFMGIPDGYYGMDELEIKQEVLKIQADLEKRGYAQTDFDGNFDVGEELMQTIRTCALCDKYISVESIKAGNEVERLLFYFSKEKIVRLEEVADKYELTQAQQSEINQSVLEHISWITQNTESTGNKVVIPQSLLTEMKNSTENEFSERAGEDELKKVGCTNAQAKIIYNGLNGTSNYISVIIVDFNSVDNDVMSIMVVNSNSGSLELLPVRLDDSEAVEFRAINYESFKTKLEEALMVIGITDDSGDFK